MKRAVFEQVYKEQNAIKTHSLVLLYMKAECCKVGKSKRRRVENTAQIDAQIDTKTDTELNTDVNANVNTQTDIQVDIEFETDTNAGNINEIDVGFVITKKISKLAVKRNKIKRQLRALFRENIDKLPQNLLYVFLVRKVKSDNVNSNSKNKKYDIENIKTSNSNNKKSKNGKETSEFNSIPSYKILKRDFDYIVKKIGATVK